MEEIAIIPIIIALTAAVRKEFPSLDRFSTLIPLVLGAIAGYYQIAELTSVIDGVEKALIAMGFMAGAKRIGGGKN